MPYVTTNVLIACGIGFRVGMLAFDFEKRIALLPDNGLTLFPATTLETIGSAVVAILSRAFSPEIKNRFLHISDFTTSQAEILSVVEETLGGDPWTRVNFPMNDYFRQCMSSIEEGTCTSKEFGGVLIPPFFGGISSWTKGDNMLLGLPAAPRNLRQEVSNTAKVIYLKATK
jgi:hypothetical protein